MSEKKPEPHRISAIPPFGLRMLPKLRKQVEDAAIANSRSLNAEIVARLEYSFEEPKRIAEEKAKMEALLIEERKEVMKRQAESLHTRMAEMASQLARIEAFMAEHDVKAKAEK